MLTNFIVENILQYVLDHHIYTLNLHSAICQLYLGNSGAKVELTIPTDVFLSPDFIVQFLEQQVCTLNWDVGFVIQTMNEIGVPLPRLLEVYDHLFKSRVRKILNKIISLNQFKFLGIGVDFFGCVFISII